MSSITVPVTRITAVRSHRNSDVLEVVTVEGVNCVVERGKYCKGDLVVFVPVGAVIPDSVLKAIGSDISMGGSQGNRVRRIMLGGEESRGLVLPPSILGYTPLGPKPFTTTASTFESWEGQDVAAWLGIVEYRWEHGM